MLVLIKNKNYPDEYRAEMLRPISTVTVENGSVVVTWKDNGVSWYDTANPPSFNMTSHTYYYLAIG